MWECGMCQVCECEKKTILPLFCVNLQCDMLESGGKYKKGDMDKGMLQEYRASDRQNI